MSVTMSSKKKKNEAKVVAAMQEMNGLIDAVTNHDADEVRAAGSVSQGKGQGVCLALRQPPLRRAFFFFGCVFTFSADTR